MKDRILAAVVAAGALGYLWVDWHMPKMALGDPLGPQAFPALVGVLLLVSAGLLALETRHRQPATVRSSSTSTRQSHHWILISMLIWTILYYAAFDTVGYAISTIVYLFGMLCYFNKGRHVANLTIAGGFTIIAYTIFSQLLDVQLPLGPTFF